MHLVGGRDIHFSFRPHIHSGTRDRQQHNNEKSPA
jgi:hypothetical protein